MSFLFIGNNRQHMPVCAKMISSTIRKVKSVAEAHMSLCNLQCATVTVV